MRAIDIMSKVLGGSGSGGGGGGGDRSFATPVRAVVGVIDAISTLSGVV